MSGLKAEFVGFAHQKLNRGVNTLGRAITHYIDPIWSEKSFLGRKYVSPFLQAFLPFHQDTH